MNGYTTPTVNGPSYQEAEAAEQRRWEREQQRQHLVEVGAHTLGYTQLPVREGAEVVAYAYQQRYQEQTQGLPAHLVNQAKQALADEASARDTLLARRAEAHAYANTNHLSDQARAMHVELTCAEAATAHRDASGRTPRALHALGELVEEVTRHKAMLQSISPRTRALDEQYQQAQAKIETDRLTAQAALTRLGVS